MLEVTKEMVGAQVTYVLAGDMDETVSFFELFGNVPPKIVVNLRDVDRINSAGVHLWLRFTGSFPSAGVSIVYSECSPAFTNHLKRILATSGGSVDSVMAPFACRHCKTEFELLIKPVELSAIKPQITGRKCPTCGQVAEFDELPVEFFSFLGA